jgi:hypothetical protein
MIILAVIFLLVRGLALYHAITQPETVNTRDSFEYKKAAVNSWEKGILYAGDLNEHINPALYSRRPPGYPLFLVFARLLSSSDLVVILLQNLINILSILFILKILMMLEFQNTISFWVMLTFVVYPTQIIYTQLIMAEILLQALLLAVLLLVIKYFETEKLKYLFWCNILLAIAALVKPVLMYFWIVNLLFHLWIFKLHRHRIILLMPLLMVIAISGWSLRNYSITHYFHFSSIKSFNLLYYNTSSFLIKNMGVEYARRTIGEIDSVSQTLPFPEANQYIEQQCFKIIKEHWLTYGIYHFRGILFFFIDPGRYDVYQFFDITQDRGFLHYITVYGLRGIPKLLAKIPLGVLAFLGIIFIFNLLFFITFILFYVKVSAPFYLKIMIFIVVLYFALVTGPLGASRFKLPIFPYLLITFAWSLQYVLLRIRSLKTTN